MSIFKDKTAFITGATSGIGFEIAKELASSGCNIVFNYRSASSRDLLVNDLGAYGVSIKAFKCDFLNQFETNDLLAFLQTQEIDILVNSAGLFPIKNLQNSTIQDYDEIFQVNVRVPFLLSKILGAKMCKNKWGRIVNIASSSAYNGSGETGLYCSSKHALLGLSRSLTKEYGPHNVRVYCLSPGSTQTKMGATDTRQDFSTFITPEEVAKKAVFIMSFDGEGISEEFRINRMIIR